MARAASVLAVILIAFVAGTFSTWETVALRWLKFDESYSHGLLMLGVSAFLVFRAWRSWPPSINYQPFWLLPLAIMVGLYIVGGLLYVEAVQQVVLIPILLAAIATACGFRTMWRYLLPVGILVFAIPFWDYLSWPLQLITVEINKLLLGLWGIEFEVEGILVFLTGVGAFEIAHGCSGLRYLLVAMSLATIYSELNYSLWRNRIALFFAAVFIALLTNWIRVFIIIHQGYVTEMQSPLINEHDFFGWILFAAALVPVFIVAGRLERQPLVETEQAGPGPAGTQRPASNGRAALAAFSVGLLLLTPLSLVAVRGGEEVRGSLTVDMGSLNGWQPLFQRLGGLWEPQFSGEDHHNRKIWFDESLPGVEQMPDSFASAHVLTYESQRPGKELVHESNRLVDTRLWRPQDSFNLEVNGQTVSGIELSHRGNGQTAVLIYGFYVSGHWSGDPIGAKLLQLYSALNGRKDASLVAVAVQCEDCQAREAATAWFSAVMVQSELALDSRYADLEKDKMVSSN